MQWAKQKDTGFTIVELLIVIVVIAILAAITVVAYTGVQNRAYDTTVQSDLSTIQKKLQLFYVDNERYPNSVNELASMKLDVSNGAYRVAPDVSVNVGFCIDSSVKSFAVIAMSKSGNRFVARQSGAVGPDTSGGTWDYSTSTLGGPCGSYGLNAPFSHGYVLSDASGPWRAWAGGN